MRGHLQELVGIEEAGEGEAKQGLVRAPGGRRMEAARYNVVVIIIYGGTYHRYWSHICFFCFSCS